MISRRSCLAAVAGVLAPACGRKNAPTAASKSPKRPAAGIPLPTKDPAAARTRPDQLAAFSSALGGNGVVLRHGAIVHQWGKPNTPLDVASASKPVLAHLVLLAVQSGRIPSLDDPVLRWLPALGDLNPSLNHKDAAITWRHLITQTSCFGVSEAPGTAARAPPRPPPVQLSATASVWPRCRNYCSTTEARLSSSLPKQRLPVRRRSSASTGTSSAAAAAAVPALAVIRSFTCPAPA